MKKFNIYIIAIILISFFAFPNKTFAKTINVPVMDDKVVFGGSYTLKSDETLDGSLIILGGVVRLEVDSIVKGDVVVFGGNLTVAGKIDQNLVAIGGVVTLENTAVVFGDLVAPASVFRKAEGSQVYGQVITDTGSLNFDIPEIPEVPEVPDLPEVPEVPEIPVVPETPNYHFNVFEQLFYSLSPISNILWGIIRIFAFSALAIIVVLFIPQNIKKASNAIVANPILSGGLGILSLIVAIPLMIIFVITIIGPIFISIIFGLGLFMGWVAVGLEVGRRIAESLSREWSLAIQVGAGTFAMLIVIGSISIVLWDFVGVLLAFGISSLGLGAVLLTRFGSRDYIPDASSHSQIVAENISQKKENDSL